MDEARQESLKTARELLRTARTATLSVFDPETGGPYGALVNVAVDGELHPLILVSKLSRHTQALLKDQRASIMVHDMLPAEGDPLTQLRVTVTGSFVVAPDSRADYLARHPYAEVYASFGDFSFWRMRAEKLYVVAGFGRVYGFGFDEVV